MTRSIGIVLMVLALGILSHGPALAQADSTCPMTPTVQSLHNCVLHAQQIGAIDNAGIAASLLAKVDAAQAALDGGQPRVAIQLLQAFIQEVEAQANVHIAQPHASHLVMHAQMVMSALGG